MIDRIMNQQEMGAKRQRPGKFFDQIPFLRVYGEVFMVKFIK